MIAFAVAIAVGTLLLMSPPATVAEGPSPFTTALFTATSAVTMTGLAVVDVGGYYTAFGEGIILGLIQLGGFGFMTSASLLFLLLARRFGLFGRLATQTERGSVDLGDLRRVLLGVGALTLVVELASAVVLTGRFIALGEYSLGGAIWRGVFHAVAAFNNAGFTLFTDGLVGFSGDPWIIVTVTLAVVAGGLGFPVWIDLRRSARHPRRLTLNTKLTLTVTGLLFLLGCGLITAIEWGNPATLGDSGVATRLLDGTLAGVMPRSGGLHVFDYAHARPETLLLTDMLMFVGGASGSTAGGLKVTTFALLLIVVLAEARGRTDVTAFRRRIPPPALRQALSIAVISVNAVVIGTLALMATSDFGLTESLFEAISAFATVGLSTGITPQLGEPGRVVLAVLMFVGRVGPLTLGVALVLRERRILYREPEERPLVG